jgi:hypothetical protein
MEVAVAVRDEQAAALLLDLDDVLEVACNDNDIERPIMRSSTQYMITRLNELAPRGPGVFPEDRMVAARAIVEMADK